MRRLKKLAPAFVLTAALTPACGGSQPTANPPEIEEHANPPGDDGPPANPPPPEDPPIAVNPPGPDGEPGIGDGAGPPDDGDDGDDGDEADE